MPRTNHVTKHDDTSTEQPTQRPEGVRAGPLAWRLGGAPADPQRPAGSKHERRREQAPQRGAVDVRRRRNPSSRFRG